MSFSRAAFCPIGSHPEELLASLKTTVFDHTLICTTLDSCSWSCTAVCTRETLSQVILTGLLSSTIRYSCSGRTETVRPRIHLGSAQGYPEVLERISPRNSAMRLYSTCGRMRKWLHEKFLRFSKVAGKESIEILSPNILRSYGTRKQSSEAYRTNLGWFEPLMFRPWSVQHALPIVQSTLELYVFTIILFLDKRSEYAIVECSVPLSYCRIIRFINIPAGITHITLFLLLVIPLFTPGGNFEQKFNAPGAR